MNAAMARGRRVVVQVGDFIPASGGAAINGADALRRRLHTDRTGVASARATRRGGAG